MSIDWLPSVCRLTMQLLHVMACMATDFHHCCTNSLSFFLTLLSTLIMLVVANKARDEEEQDRCLTCKREISSHNEGPIDVDQEGIFFSADDAKTVLEKLDMWEETREGEEEYRVWYDGKCRDCRATDEAMSLLEGKEASAGELREAFAVFDRNGDGFVTPMELRGVMRRLGFREGWRLEDCRRMVEAFDEDGDGRICFSEFKMLMENAS